MDNFHFTVLVLFLLFYSTLCLVIKRVMFNFLRVVLFLKKYNLAASGLSCAMWDLHCGLWA